MSKVKIKFLAERIVRDHEQRVVEHHKPGQVKEMSEASARRWVHRGLAEEISGGARKAGKAKTPAAAATEAGEGDSAGDDSIMAERKAPPPADPMTHGDHPAAAKAAGKT